MKKFCTLFALLGLLSDPLFAQESETFEFDLSQVEIAYEKFELANGLTLVVHEDHKAPIIAVNLWYHVGSKDEPDGRSGFAHLFEHLMFNGSENYNDDYFQAIERIGGTDVNGTTSFDRTNYFQNVPKSALEIALFMESDRMGHFKGAIDSARLDEQRDVVKNEKRQGENQPYGQTWNYIVKQCFPVGHPYHHTTIGSMEDLTAASLEDVKEWFSTYYGPSNAVIAIAGDINAEEAYNKVNAYFGNIPSGPPIGIQVKNIAKRTDDSRDLLYDRVPQVRLEMIYNVAPWGSEDAFMLDLAANVLSQGKNSRLYKRLVYDQQLCTYVSASNAEFEIAGLFNIQADVKPDVDQAQVEAIIDEELNRFIKEGPTLEELNRVKTQYFASFIRGIERIGGFGGKSDILASNTIYGGSPDFYMTRLKATKEATREEVRKAAEKWLTSGRYTLEIVPFPEYSTTGEEIDRRKLPEMGPDATVMFPQLQRSKLSNGMNVILAQRKTIPMVELRMILDAGYAADQFASPGTAQLAINMLDEGTKTRTSLEINNELAMLGANLGSGSNLDQSFVTMSALKARFDESLNLFSDVILNPSFPQQDFDRLKNQQLVSIRQEKTNPVQMAIRTLPKFMYGENHAYGNPLTGSGYEETVSKLTVEEIKQFYSTWFKPNNATIVAVGDITMEELTNKLERSFKKWKQGEVPKKNLAKVGTPNKNKIYLMDKPGSPQSVIIAGHVTAPYGEQNEIAVQMMNTILGGEFTSRVNMNLREEKGWAYGASTFLLQAEGQRPFLAYAPVQSDKTAPSMKEIVNELSSYVTNNPATIEELEKSRRNEVLSLPGQWETLSAVGGSINNIVRYNLTDDYYQTYASEIKNLTLDQIRDAAKQIIKQNDMIWMVIGDKAQIESEIRALGIGEVILIDPDGNILSPSSQ